MHSTVTCYSHGPCAICHTCVLCLLTISQTFSFRTASCIIRRKISFMFAELELTWRDVEQVGVSSYLPTDSRVRFLIHVLLSLVAFIHYTIPPHPDCHIAAITLFHSRK